MKILFGCIDEDRCADPSFSYEAGYLIACLVIGRPNIIVVPLIEGLVQDKADSTRFTVFLEKIWNDNELPPNQLELEEDITQVDHHPGFHSCSRDELKDGDALLCGVHDPGDRKFVVVYPYQEG